MDRLPLSHSAIELFEACPARFKAERVDKIKPLPQVHLASGSILHEVADRYFKHLVETKQRSDFAWIAEEGERVWRGRLSNYEWRILPESMYEDYTGILLVIREECVIDPELVLGSETDLAFTDGWVRVPWDDPSAFFRGKLDRLALSGDWVADVWDLKTGRRIETDANTPQTRRYGFMVKLILPEVKKVRAHLFYPRRRATYSADLDDAKLAGVGDAILRVSDQIEEMRASGQWPTSVSERCADCPVFYSCPEKRKAEGAAMVPETHEQAEDLVKRWVLLERAREDTRDLLKNWVAMHGPIAGGGFYADFALQHRLSFDTEELYRILQEAKLNPLRYLKGDTRKLAKEVKRDRDLMAKLEAITTDKPSTRFSLLKAGDDGEDEEEG